MKEKNDIDEMLDRLVQVSMGVYQKTAKPIEENWKLALALESQGWVISRYEPTSERKDAIKFIFIKEGVEKEVLMGYTDQQRWFDFVSKRD